MPRKLLQFGPEHTTDPAHCERPGRNVDRATFEIIPEKSEPQNWPIQSGLPDRVDPRAVKVLLTR